MNMLPKVRLITALIASFSICLLLSPQAVAQALTPDQLTLQVKSLNAKTQKSEERVNSVSQDLNNLQQEVSKIGRLIDNRAMLEMLQRVDVLADEVSQLRGEMEQQGHDLTEIKKRQRELYIDVDRRMRDLESRTTTQSRGLPPVQLPAQVGLPVIPAGSGASNAQAPVVDPVQNAVIPDSASLTTGNTAGQTSSAAIAPSGEESAAYQAAFDTLKEGRYKKAKAELKTFLQQYPKSSFAGNAQYWLGEANYVTRHFDQGVIEFQQVIKGYPGSSKVPDAMLKLGYTYYELKQFDLAKTLLQDLRNRFPDSTAFRLAGKRLDRIRKEGN